MPGVPSGRGCEGCRKQKKKCDEKAPTCGRCKRLSMNCVGSGQKRYKFKEQQGFWNEPKRERTTKVVLQIEKKNTVVPLLPRTPVNELTGLINSFVETMKPSTSAKYNILWTYGTFFENIPSRLGTNEALDSSVAALVSAHSSLCLGRKVGVDALAKYSHALSTLRHYLDDPAAVNATETLAAVMVLLICQSFIGVNRNSWTGHCEGAAVILKSRKYYDPKDEFEAKLLMSLRGPVLFEGLLNDKIQFTASEWRTIVENKFDGTSQIGQMMRCLSRNPQYMKRGKKMLSGERDDPGLILEARNNYETFSVAMRGFYERVAEMHGFTLDTVALPPEIYSLYDRAYAIALTIGILLNSVLSAIDVDDVELPLESAYFTDEILKLAEPAAAYRPIGGSYMGLCLIAAWVGTTDSATRIVIEKELAVFQSDFPASQATSVSELNRIYKHLHLQESFCMNKNS